MIDGGAPTPVKATASAFRKIGVKACPHCAEELPDEATVCSTCYKDPAVAPVWAAPKQPGEAGHSRLGNVWGPDGVLPTSERVPASYKAPWRAGVPPKVWASLLLWWCWGWVAPVPSGMAALIMPAGYRRADLRDLG